MWLFNHVIKMLIDLIIIFVGINIGIMLVQFVVAILAGAAAPSMPLGGLFIIPVLLLTRKVV